jgi:hypothetical protein
MRGQGVPVSRSCEPASCSASATSPPVPGWPGRQGGYSAGHGSEPAEPPWPSFAASSSTTHSGVTALVTFREFAGSRQSGRAHAVRL